MTPFHLNNKTILVSGATSPIGHAICERILEMGGKVIALGRNQNKLSDLVNKSTYPENLQTKVHILKICRLNM